jgi:hypothetical protein
MAHPPSTPAWPSPAQERKGQNIATFDALRLYTFQKVDAYDAPLRARRATLTVAACPATSWQSGS